MNKFIELNVISEDKVKIPASLKTLINVNRVLAVLEVSGVTHFLLNQGTFFGVSETYDQVKTLMGYKDE